MGLGAAGLGVSFYLSSFGLLLHFASASSWSKQYGWAGYGFAHWSSGRAIGPANLISVTVGWSMWREFVFSGVSLHFY
ncbi:hypothetical protein QBC40DRAFT_97545 [Triangularia verruculosa]|uniref:Uncharacterized protein n=1 Tax=Triangularia verruculosa TaxID=2587418 RepID=A0AAN6XPW0_9PEZI|nr:hypothetical protein QBC40DRAFT_97545 [Triangularia verruculosa]